MENEAVQKQVESELAQVFDDSFIIPVAIEDFVDYEVVYSFLPEHKNRQLKAIMRKNNLLQYKRDITQEVLNGTLNDNDFVFTFKDKLYAELLEYFLLNNLTVDMILDKISELGFESLTAIERKILGMQSESNKESNCD